MKKCPFCDEMIEKISIKCNYCGETVENSKGIKNTKIYKVGKEKYKNFSIIYILIGITYFISQKIIKDSQILDLIGIIQLLAFSYLFYLTILRYHDIGKTGRRAFFILIPIAMFFIMYNLSTENSHKNEGINNLRKDTIINMCIYVIVMILFILFIPINL